MVYTNLHETCEVHKEAVVLSSHIGYFSKDVSRACAILYESTRALVGRVMFGLNYLYGFM